MSGAPLAMRGPTEIVVAPAAASAVAG